MLYKIDHRAKGWRVQREKTTKRVISQGFFLKKGHPRTLFHLFSSFQTNITIFTTNKGENYPSNIWRWDSNPQPLKPPVTTRPWLPPIISQLSRAVASNIRCLQFEPSQQKNGIKIMFLQMNTFGLLWLHLLCFRLFKLFIQTKSKLFSEFQAPKLALILN